VLTTPFRSLLLKQQMTVLRRPLKHRLKGHLLPLRLLVYELGCTLDQSAVSRGAAVTDKSEVTHQSSTICPYVLESHPQHLKTTS